MMNRRDFVSGMLVAVPLAASFEKVAVAQEEESRVQVRRQWDAELGAGSEIDRFVTTISAFESVEDASAYFENLLDEIDEGRIYSEETGADARGEDSFFVRFDDPNFVIDEFTIRFGSVIYEFRSEAVHYGGARDAFRLMETVYSRVDETAKTTEELTLLLPTRDEVSMYGLTRES